MRSTSNEAGSKRRPKQLIRKLEKNGLYQEYNSSKRGQSSWHPSLQLERSFTYHIKRSPAKTPRVRNSASRMTPHLDDDDDDDELYSCAAMMYLAGANWGHNIKIK